MALSKKKLEEVREKSIKGSKTSYIIIPTNIRSLDKVLSGGLIAGGMVNFWGIEGSGKSNICAWLAKEFQEKGQAIYWDDTEGNVNIDWISKIGVDAKEVLWNENCYSGEEHMECLIVHTLDNDVGLCILDSVNNLVPEIQIDAVASNTRQTNALLLSRTIPQLNIYRSILRNKGEIPPTYLFVNQVRENQGGYTMSYKYSGGHILRHAWSQSIRMAKIEYLDEKDGSLSKDRRNEAKWYKVTCIIERNRNGRDGIPCEITFDIENARFDNLKMLIEEKSKYVKSGAWYKLGKNSWQGVSKFLKALEEDDKLVKELEKIGE